MLRGFYIAVFFCSILVYGQTGNHTFELFYPDYVVSGKKFTVSVFAGHYPDSNTAVSYTLFSEQKLSLNYGSIQSADGEGKLRVAVDYDAGSGFYSYSTSFPLSDYISEEKNAYEVMFNFTAPQESSNLVYLKAKITRDDEVLFSKVLPEDMDRLRETQYAQIQFYRPQQIAGNALFFAERSSLQLGFNTNEKQNTLTTEFWIQFNKPTHFLEIRSKNFRTTELSLELNEYYFLALSGNMLNIQSYKNFCISLDTWYHFIMIFDPGTKNLIFRVNDETVAEYHLDNILSVRDLRFAFGSTLKKSSGFSIDLMKVWSSQAYPFSAVAGNNYFSTSTDSARLLLQTGFDRLEDVTNSNEIFLRPNNAQLVKSDAPIFAAAPDLRFSLFAGAYMFEWQNGAAGIAESYKLQKSVDGKPFRTIKSFEVIDEDDYTYNYLDAEESSGNVLYYRIKQINKDNTNTFSDQVKIGMGEMETISVLGNFPNPFNPVTTIKVEMIESSEATITVHNLQGKEVASLFQGFLEKGIHEFQFNGEKLPSGIYLYSIMTPGGSQTRKMILAK